VTFAELVLFVALFAGVYFLLRPLRNFLEDLFLKLLDPRRRGVVDVKAEKTDEDKE
jgi:hypothetical protein